MLYIAFLGMAVTILQIVASILEKMPFGIYTGVVYAIIWSSVIVYHLTWPWLCNILH